MDLFDVYPLFDIEPVKGEGCYVYDKNGVEYLDLYGGHAVISIGHAHEHYVKMIKDQVSRLGFYSNSVQIPQQKELAKKLGEISGYEDYKLFFTNSGAESNENALKLASFQTGRKKVVSFEKGFHGRTSLAVEVTDNKNIQAPVNITGNVEILPLNDVAAFDKACNEEVAAVIIESIQGLAGIYSPTEEFLKHISKKCKESGTLLICDEVQSGYGRSGKFFAHQYADIAPDIITLAKGMGNGFPMGAVMISPKIEAKYGLLGTTFGGNHLACAAGIAVLDVLKEENLVASAKRIGDYVIEELKKIKGINVRGMGLMIGIDLGEDCAVFRKKLLFDYKIFTGTSANKTTIRLLPPLSITKKEMDVFLAAFKQVMES